MANDAIHTGEAIGSGIAKSVDHFNHLSAKEKGYIVGHDVAPTVIGTIVAPELIPEGALAAGLGKVASVVGTVIKEEGIVAKVATTFESAREKMTAISEKMAGLNKKMEVLQDDVRCTHKMDRPEFEHIKPVSGCLIIHRMPYSTCFTKAVTPSTQRSKPIISRTILDLLIAYDCRTAVRTRTFEGSSCSMGRSL